MFESRVLETAIGLIFLFLGFALIATAIQELIASALRLRSRSLNAGMRAMLADGIASESFYRKLMAHPAITQNGRHPSYISAEQFSNAAISILSAGDSLAKSPNSFAIIVRNLPDYPYKRVMEGILKDTDKDLTGFEARLQIWFDQSMDRVSGSYKRISQYISLGIGAILAFGLQANAFAIGYTLWSEPNNKLTIAATSLAKGQSPPSASDALSGLSQFHLLPIWEEFPKHLNATWFLGCAVTAIAVSLGAPFWFDTLQKAVNIRSTGPKPAKPLFQSADRSATSRL